ncbi:hypothetical protein L0U85_01285 [Glycomyces sp. L485]|uniref:hypothetical protein n=1 Tax=Glycomyces sp. L485 TaxID=2909235 RepID=UPI001F4AD875|nr:hypothetical protein [Glycomyces sp. L485]MCH7229500.1 hypothetical protein [Glycomyces sp. L485]
MQRFQDRFVKGSEPPSVYWQRRAIVAGAAVALIVVVVFAFKALGSGGGGASVDGEAEPQEWVRPSQSSTLKRPHIAPTPEAEPSSASPSPTEPAIAACAEEELLLQVVAAFDEARSGAEVPVSVLVASGSEATCTAELGEVEVELAAGSDVVYSTAHCEEAEPNTVELEAGAGQTAEFTLDSRASDPGCGGDRRRLPAGDYEIRARLGEAVSPPTSLTLT